MTAPLLVATVGSDHHPFDRLVDWLDTWLESARHPDLRYVCQHATARVPRTGEATRFVDHDALLGLMREASVVVSHGGPGTLLESLRAGRVPVAVPRLARLGEAVDDHQRAFCELLSERHEVVLVESEDALARALALMLAEPDAFRAPPLSWDDLAPTLARFTDLVAACRPARRARLLAALRPRTVGGGSAAGLSGAGSGR